MKKLEKLWIFGKKGFSLFYFSRAIILSKCYVAKLRQEYSSRRNIITMFYISFPIIPSSYRFLFEFPFDFSLARVFSLFFPYLAFPLIKIHVSSGISLNGWVAIHIYTRTNCVTHTDNREHMWMWRCSYKKSGLRDTFIRNGNYHWKTYLVSISIMQEFDASVPATTTTTTFTPRQCRFDVRISCILWLYTYRIWKREQTREWNQIRRLGTYFILTQCATKLRCRGFRYFIVFYFFGSLVPPFLFLFTPARYMHV